MRYIHIIIVFLANLVFLNSTQAGLANFGLNLPDTYKPLISGSVSDPWRWRQIADISSMGVRSITDDTHGNMWFGLRRGIIKYDGYNWQLFDESPWLQKPVTILKSFDDGRLYAGSQTGLLKFDGMGWEKIFPSNDTIEIPVTSIIATPDNNLLAGIKDGFLKITGEGTYIIYTTLSHVESFIQAHPGSRIIILPDEVLFRRNFARVDDIFFYNPEQVWLFMSQNNQGKLLKFSPSDTSNGVLYGYDILTEIDGYALSSRSQIIRASNNHIWIINGFYKNGILRYDGKTWKQIKLSDKFGGDELHTSISEIANGEVWVGGLGKLFIYKNGRWDFFSAPDFPIPSSRIMIHETRNGMVWLAGLLGDVFRIHYDPGNWTKYYGLNFQFQDEQGQNWFISNDNKVVVQHKGRWEYFDTGDGLIDAPVRVVKTRHGTIWVAGSHRGVAATARLQKNNSWTIYSHPLLSWGIDPRSVFQDREGNLWFGASVDRQDLLGQVSGVLQLTNPDDSDLIWKHHTGRDGIVQHNAYGIGQSPDGSIWLGGTNLLRLQGNRWNQLAGHEYFNEFIDIVHSRYYLWVGSRHYGLFRFDGETWSRFTKEHGLPGNTIISVFEETPESIWAITDKGIAWSDGNTWSELMFSEELKIPREGGEIMVAADGSVWLNKSLREWKRRAFPYNIITSEAMEGFWALRYIRDEAPPRTNITLFTPRVDPAGNTVISWLGKDYWDETPSGRLVYSWRLNQNHWSHFSSQTSVTLSNLGSGNYTFEVRARDLDGNIEPSPATVEFVVIAPVWKRLWFILLVISFMAIIGFYEFRMIKRNRVLFDLNFSLSEKTQI